MGWGDTPVVVLGNLSGESSMVTMFASGRGKEVAEPWRVACRLITCRYIESVTPLHSLNAVLCEHATLRCVLARSDIAAEFVNHGLRTCMEGV